MRKGDCEDHAVLLCSLLLGFGLDAYVCIVGTVIDNNENERDHLWVLTAEFGKRQKSSKRVVFGKVSRGNGTHTKFKAGTRKILRKIRRCQTTALLDVALTIRVFLQISRLAMQSHIATLVLKTGIFGKAWILKY